METENITIAFAEWLTKKYVLFYNPDTSDEKSWFEQGVDEDNLVFYNSKELYKIFVDSLPTPPEGKKLSEITDEEREELKSIVFENSLLLKKKYNPIQIEWENKTPNDFRLRVIQSLELAMSNEEIFRHNDTLYLSQRDLILLVENLLPFESDK